RTARLPADHRGAAGVRAENRSAPGAPADHRGAAGVRAENRSAPGVPPHYRRETSSLLLALHPRTSGKETDEHAGRRWRAPWTRAPGRAALPLSGSALY